MKTGNAPRPARCALGKLIPSTIDTEAVKHDGWNDHHILVVQANDPRITWIDRQIIESIGARLYGRR